MCNTVSIRLVLYFSTKNIESWARVLTFDPPVSLTAQTEENGLLIALREGGANPADLYLREVVQVAGEDLYKVEAV